MRALYFFTDTFYNYTFHITYMMYALSSNIIDYLTKAAIVTLAKSIQVISCNTSIYQSAERFGKVPAQSGKVKNQRTN